MREVPAVVFERSTCDLCGSDHTEPVFGGPDRLLHLPGEFMVVRCQQCGLIRQDPRPTAETIGYYYPPEYEPYSIAIDDEPSWFQRFDRRYGMRKRRRAIERVMPDGRLLDVGCATGNFIHEMARCDHWAVEGVEANADAAAYARRRLGLTVHSGRLTEVDLSPRSFDVVTLWNVLEHLHHPVENLKAIRRLLKPGGLFVFSIPSLDSLEAKLFGRYWLGWELPRHLYFFEKPVITRALAELGMTVTHWDCLVGAYPSFLLTLRFALDAAGSGVWPGRALHSLAGSLPMRLIMALPFWLLTQANRASLITGFARVLES